MAIMWLCLHDLMFSHLEHRLVTDGWTDRLTRRQLISVACTRKKNYPIKVRNSYRI